MQSNVKLGSGTFGNNLRLSLIAGPCVLESHSHARKMVEKLLNINGKIIRNYAIYFFLFLVFANIYYRYFDLNAV